MPRIPLLTLALLATSTAAMAKQVAPEIQRPTGTAQAVGVAHSIRTIPEACARLEGVFTGQAMPYQFKAVRTSASCQPRARLVDAAKLKPSQASGWVLNDEIRIPNAACPSQLAVVQVWRKPSNATPPKLDGQGRSRVYLDDAKQAASAGTMPAIAMYAAAMTVEGKACP